MLRKKYIVIPVIILVISVVLITGLAVTPDPGCQAWHLTSSPHDTEPHEVMQKAYVSTDNVTIGAGQSNIWVTDEIAVNEVTFSGNWVIELRSCTDSTVWREYITALAGIWDPVADNFTPFGDVGFIREYPTPNIIRIIHKSGWNTIPKGSYLALEVTNNDGSDHDICTDGDAFMMSCSDPGFPLAEIATGVLLFGGLLGLAAYIVIRRRKSVS